MFTFINFCTGERESVESAESLGAQGEIQKAQRTQKIWKEGIIFQNLNSCWNVTAKWHDITL